MRWMYGRTETTRAWVARRRDWRCSSIGSRTSAPSRVARGNDPRNILRNLIFSLCILSTATCALEVILYLCNKDGFRVIYLSSTCFHLLFEDGAQIVLYSIMGGANAAAGRHTMTLVLCGLAGLQSLVYFLIKLELFKGE